MFYGVIGNKGGDYGGNKGLFSLKKLRRNNSIKVSDKEFERIVNEQNDMSRDKIDSGMNLLKLSETKNFQEMKQAKENSKKLKSIGKLNTYLFDNNNRDQDEKYNYKKTKEAEYLYYKYLFNTGLQCIFTLISIFSSILQYEIGYTGTQDQKLNIALWFCFASSVFLWILIIFEYYICCRILYLNKSLSERIWRTETSNLVSLLSTLAIFLVHPNPAFKGISVNIYNEKYQVNTKYTLNAIFCLICLLRMWYFIKFYLIYSDYYSPRTQRVCQMNNFDTNLTFSLKANMVKTPYIAYLLLFLVVLTYCSYCLRIFERELDDASGRNFSSFWNTIWCLIITMTTVGYGDYYPSSTLGRMIGILACICGVFLISMLIVTITNVLNFQGTERNVFLILQRIKLTKEKDDIASKLIVKYLKFMKLLKKSKNIQEELKLKDKLRDEIQLCLHYFREKSAEIDSTFPAYSDFDNVIDNLDFLDDSLDSLTKKYDILEKHIVQIIDKLNN